MTKSREEEARQIAETLNKRMSHNKHRSRRDSLRAVNIEIAKYAGAYDKLDQLARDEKGITIISKGEELTQKLQEAKTLKELDSLQKDKNKFEKKHSYLPSIKKAFQDAKQLKSETDDIMSNIPKASETKAYKNKDLQEKIISRLDKGIKKIEKRIKKMKGKKAEDKKIQLLQQKLECYQMSRLALTTNMGFSELIPRDNRKEAKKAIKNLQKIKGLLPCIEEKRNLGEYREKRSLFGMSEAHETIDTPTKNLSNALKVLDEFDNKLDLKRKSLENQETKERLFEKNLQRFQERANIHSVKKGSQTLGRSSQFAGSQIKRKSIKDITDTIEPLPSKLRK